MPAVLPALGAFFSSAAGAAVAGGVASAGIGAGLSKVLSTSPKINIPPPPGAALIDPAGEQAAADQRRRAAGSGGLSSTITGANAPSGPTSGSKQLLGA
jgi:hypothetical protein